MFGLDQPPPEPGEAEGTEVDAPIAECPDDIAVRIVDDGGDASTNAATIETRIEVSNRRADHELPTGFDDDSPDRDNFKIEIYDTSVEGDTIAPDKVEIEILAPGPPATAFSPRRKLNVELKRVGDSGHLYRSKYLRLVVDEIDHAVNPDQMLLADWDPSDDTIEILGQVMRVTYTTNCDEHTAEATVGSADRTHIRVAVHILNNWDGGVVTTAQARERILKWFRRMYAQISMAPKLLENRYVDPVENLLSISNNSGANATGGDGSEISFRIYGEAGGEEDDVLDVGPLTLTAGASPMDTAAALARLVTPPFTARTVQNPPTLETDIIQGSADLIISHSEDRAVFIEDAASTDTAQTAVVGRARIVDLRSDTGDEDPKNWVVGTEDQRAALQAYDTGDDRIDIIVPETLSSGDRGIAQMPGTIYAAGKQAITKITMSAFCTARTMDGTDFHPSTCPHEAGHALLDAIHVASNDTQLMRNGTGAINTVDGAKRFSESAVRFGTPALEIEQESRIRRLGAAVLEPLT